MAKGTQDPRYRRMIGLLAAAREAAGMSQADLAEKIRQRQQFVSKYESCERRLDAIEFIDICRALALDPTAVIEKAAPDIFKRAGVSRS
ncbi:MAG TPA: helix-turn-helix transcriptional regulator [Sphingomicrobium sp.]|nr:helix-turn-helix transcriptional regulator [Sphingomicrobium sp.]